MKPLAILAAALVALYMLGRSRGRTLGPAPALDVSEEEGLYVPMSWTYPDVDMSGTRFYFDPTKPSSSRWRN